MIDSVLMWMASTTADGPSPSPSLNPDAVTPGPVGFTVFLLLIAAVVLLGWDLVRRIRRINYRAQVNEMLDAEERDEAGDSHEDSGDNPKR